MAIPVALLSTLMPIAVNGITNICSSHSQTKIERARFHTKTECERLRTIGNLGTTCGQGLFGFFSTVMNNRTAEKLKAKELKVLRTKERIAIINADSEERKLEIKTKSEERCLQLENEKITKLKELENEDNQDQRYHEERMLKIEASCRKQCLEIQAETQKALQQAENERITKLKELENADNQAMLQEENRHEEVIRLYEYEQERFMTEKKLAFLNKLVDISKQVYDSKLDAFKQQLDFIQDVFRSDLSRIEEEIKKIKEDENKIMYFSIDMDVVEKNHYLLYLSKCKEELRKEKKEITNFYEDSSEQLNKEIKELELKSDIPSFMLPQGSNNNFLN